MGQPFVPGPPPTEYRSFVSDSRRWQNFEHRPGDIYVCTPPKCGTTWTQTIVAMLLFPDGSLPAPVVELAPWIEARFVDLHQALASLAAQTHRRSIKTHTPADGIPWHSTGHYIVVGRDGRDTFMSFVNHIASMRPDRVSEMIQSAIADDIPMLATMPSSDIHEFFAEWLADGAFFHFINTYWERREEPNVLFVHFDDLKLDLEGQVRRIAAFLGIPVDEALLPGILQRCSFAWMRANADRIGEFGEMFVGGAEAFFFKGTNGRWRDVLSDEELALYESRSTQMLAPGAKQWLDRGGPGRGQPS